MPSGTCGKPRSRQKRVTMKRLVLIGTLALGLVQVTSAAAAEAQYGPSTYYGNRSICLTTSRQIHYARYNWTSSNHNLQFVRFRVYNYRACLILHQSGFVHDYWVRIWRVW